MTVSPRQRMLVERAIGYLNADSRHDVAEVVEDVLRIASEPPAWVEQLAARFELDAQAIADNCRPDAEEDPYTLRYCAAELRARAKGTP